MILTSVLDSHSPVCTTVCSPVCSTVCSPACSTIPNNDIFISGGSPFTSVDNGQNGQVTFESYKNNVNCYVDIGSSCPNGLEVEITHMELEIKTDYDYEPYVYEYVGCYDTIHFAWLNKEAETVEQTDPQCGCISENHPSCDKHPFSDDDIEITKQPTQYTLVGTDVKLILQSDQMDSGGKIQVDWKCNTQITTTTFTSSGRS